MLTCMIHNCMFFSDFPLNASFRLVNSVWMFQVNVYASILKDRETGSLHLHQHYFSYQNKSTKRFSSL